MSRLFEDREKGAEAKFAHEEEQRFKVMSRRNKLVGLWAAQEMGLPAAKSDAYAKELVRAEVGHHGSDDLLARIRADFTAHKVTMSDHMIRRKIEELFDLAGDQLKAKTKKP